jgi:hypothetical protein
VFGFAFFAECISLLSAALGKIALCRVLDFYHLAKKVALGKGPVPVVPAHGPLPSQVVESPVTGAINYVPLPPVFQMFKYQAYNFIAC